MISLLNANALSFIPCETTYTRSHTINHQADMFIPLTIRDEENRKVAIICAIILIISSFVIFEISKCDESISQKLNIIRCNNLNNVVIRLLNINSFQNKYDAIKFIIPGNIDIMIILETKLDDSYPTFFVHGFTMPFRRDRNRFGGGMLIYVREDIPCKLLNNHNLPDDIEGLFVELNFRKTRLLLVGTYHPPCQNDEYYFKSIGKGLDIYSANYDKYILAGDFNAEDKEAVFRQFLELKNIVHECTCFKSLNNPSCIDLFLTNSYSSFHNTNVISTGLSDFHKMVVTVMKSTLPKAKPKQINII